MAETVYPPATAEIGRRRKEPRAVSRAGTHTREGWRVSAMSARPDRGHASAPLRCNRRPPQIWRTSGCM